MSQWEIADFVVDSNDEHEQQGATVTVIETWVIDAVHGVLFDIKPEPESTSIVHNVPKFSHCPVFSVDDQVWVQFNNGQAQVIHGRLG